MTRTDTTISSNTTDAACIVRCESGRVVVYFGRLDRGEFVPSFSQPSKSYKTMAGAMRQAERFTA